MAKGSAMGLWRGKKGSSVFYKIANSNSAQKQGIRERVYEVSNPQTVKQAAQRMKLLPAQRLYGAIKPVIERSWQGLKYGERARREFLKLALAQQSGWPYVEKSSPYTIPGAYQIAKGTLQEVVCSAGDECITTSIPLAGSGNNMTLGELSAAFIAAGYLAGMQVTFLSVPMRSDNPATLVYDVESVILDESSTTLISELMPTINVYADGGYLVFTTARSGNYNQVAGAVIVSQDATTPLRSNARIFVETSYIEQFFAATSYFTARASYMKKSSSVSRDWPVEPIDLGEDETQGAYELTGLTGDNAAFNGRNIYVRYKVASDGTVSLNGVYTLAGEGYNSGGNIEAGACVVSYDTDNLLSASKTVSGEVIDYNLLVASVPALAELPQIPFV